MRTTQTHINLRTSVQVDQRLLLALSNENSLSFQYPGVSETEQEGLGCSFLATRPLDKMKKIIVWGQTVEDPSSSSTQGSSNENFKLPVQVKI